MVPHFFDDNFRLRIRCPAIYNERLRMPTTPGSTLAGLPQSRTGESNRPSSGPETVDTQAGPNRSWPGFHTGPETSTHILLPCPRLNSIRDPTWSMTEPIVAWIPTPSWSPTHLFAASVVPFLVLSPLPVPSCVRPRRRQVIIHLRLAVPGSWYISPFAGWCCIIQTLETLGAAFLSINMHIIFYPWSQ